MMHQNQVPFVVRNVTRLSAMLIIGLLLPSIALAAEQQSRSIIPLAKLVPSDGYITDEFGVSVAIDKNVAFVGSHRDDDNGRDSGSVYVFEERDGSWVRSQKLAPLDAEAYDGFGYALAYDNGTLVITAPYNDDHGINSGSAYVFERQDGGWIQSEKLVPPDGGESSKFGNTVAVLNDTIVVGAMQDNDQSGSAYVFERQDGGWIQSGKLVASDAAPLDHFGESVALTDNVIAVGAYYDDDNGEKSGAAYIFEKQGRGWTETKKLTPSDGDADDQFGCSVALSTNTLIVGACWDEYNGNISGSAYVFERLDKNWTEKAKLIPADGQPGDFFAKTMSMSQDTIVIGANWDDDNGQNAGSAYIFNRVNGVWVESGKLLAPDGKADANFGRPSVINDGMLIVGAVGDDSNGQYTGAAYVFSISPQNTQPTVSAGGPYTASEGTTFILDKATAIDVDGDHLFYHWEISSDLCSISNPSALNAEVLCIDDGTYEATLTVDDGLNDPVASDATVNVANLNPVIGAVDNNGPINEGDSATISVNVNDPAGPNDPLVYEFDCEDDGVYEVGPQTENSTACRYFDNGNYTVGIRVRDDGTGETTAETTVIVNNVAPHIGSITTVPEPVAVATNVYASAGFVDAGIMDTHTAHWEWGDGTTSNGTIDETGGSGTVNAVHAYATAGVYTVKVTVKDKDGSWGESIYQFVVVYDPSGGFVSGGGWVNSPAGAYVTDPALIGKASFGFVSKYQKGATLPTGNTEFQFKAGNLNFRSASYDWLVVAGAKAMFKGVGTINGAGNYGFMLSAIDADQTASTETDLFRIKIWDKDNGDAIVYDNQLGASDDADPTTAIGGGNIIVHKSK